MPMKHGMYIKVGSFIKISNGPMDYCIHKKYSNWFPGASFTPKCQLRKVLIIIFEILHLYQSQFKNFERLIFDIWWKSIDIIRYILSKKVFLCIVFILSSLKQGVQLYQESIYTIKGCRNFQAIHLRRFVVFLQSIVHSACLIISQVNLVLSST